MDNNDQNFNDNLFYKFRSLDKEVAQKMKCLLKGCHRLAKYSISFLKPGLENNEGKKDYKQIVKFICSNHLENWDSIKANILEESEFNRKNSNE